MCHSKVQIFEYRWALYKYTYNSMRIQDTGAHCSYDSNTLHRTVTVQSYLVQIYMEYIVLHLAVLYGTSQHGTGRYCTVA
jgi:hypothetical protein